MTTNQTTPPLSNFLLPKAANNRHGLTLEPQQAQISKSDNDIIHIGVPGSVTSPWESAAGGVGYSYEVAQFAAIGEAIERYAAAAVQVPIKLRKNIPEKLRVDAEAWSLFTAKQRKQDGFPFPNIYNNDCPYTKVFNLADNSEVWVPLPFVVLRDDYQTGVPTSSGLAAGPSAQFALLRSVQELIERDALMMTWLHGVAAHAVKLPAKIEAEVAELGGEVWVFDLTPAYSPFPVVAVAGGIPKRGVWRYSLGVACRETWDAALEKAYLEWNQGVLFAGIYDKFVDVKNLTNPTKVKSFDEHAIFYTVNPKLWHDLPMFADVTTLHKPRTKGKQLSTWEALTTVNQALQKAGIRMFYRDITTIEAEQVGLRVIRSVSPDLAQIFAHQEWMLTDKLEDKLASRYPWAISKNFPNTMPHPLG